MLPAHGRVAAAQAGASPAKARHVALHAIDGVHEGVVYSYRIQLPPHQIPSVGLAPQRHYEGVPHAIVCEHTPRAPRRRGVLLYRQDRRMARHRLG